jgi:hypothetical protein
MMPYPTPLISKEKNMQEELTAEDIYVAPDQITKEDK